MSARDEFQRLHAIEKHAHDYAHEARKLIEQLPDTTASFCMVLEAITARIQEAQGCDYSMVLDHLQEANEALVEVRAFSDDEVACYIKERMQGKRAEVQS